MRKAKAALALLLAALCLLSCLTGCGKKGDSGPDFYYEAKYVAIPQKFNYISAMCSDGEVVYFATQEPDEKKVDQDGNIANKLSIYRMKLDGSDFKCLDSYEAAQLPDGHYGNTSVQRMTFNSKGQLCVMEQQYTYTYNLPEDFDETTDNRWDYYQDGGTKLQWICLDTDGNEVSRTDLNTVLPEGTYLQTAVMDGQDKIYLLDGDSTLYALTDDGQLDYKVESPDNVYGFQLYCLKDGRIALQCNSDKGGQMLKPFNSDSRSWGDPIKMPNVAYSIYGSSKDYDYVCAANNGLIGLKADGSYERMFDWINCNVNGDNIYTVLALEDGRILAVEQNYDDGNGAYNLILLERKPSSERPKQTVLTLASLYGNYQLRRMVLQFNKSHSDYRIEVKDYSDYNTDDDYTAGLTKLTTEILAGNVPDILVTDNLPVSSYAAKGYLEDLKPYMDKSGITMVGALEKALMKDGKLYEMVTGFSIATAVVPAKLVEGLDTWTLQDVLNTLKKLPEGASIFSEFDTRDSVLNAYCSNNLDKYIDWTTGKCSFDSQDFISVLEFAKSFPAEFDYNNYNWDDYKQPESKIMAGQQLMMSEWIGDAYLIQFCNYFCGGKADFRGYPTENGSTNCFNTSNGSGSLAMSSKCTAKDVAWEFIAELMSEEYQKDNTWGCFPSNQKVFDQRIKEAMTPEYDETTGEEIPKNYYYLNDQEIKSYALSEQEYQQLMDLINSTTSVYGYDEGVMDVIEEDVKAFFAGQKTAQETAALIQNRVQTYVNEKM